MATSSSHKAVIKREEIKTHLLRNNDFASANFSTLLDRHLEALFREYDDTFFGGALRAKLKASNATLTFDTNRMSSHKIAGKCSRKGLCSYTISVPRAMFIDLFRSEKREVLRANGLLCSSRLDCLQLVFEHELVHLIVMLYDVAKLAQSRGLGKKMYSDHGTAFKCLAKDLFGHTDIRHNLTFGDVTGFLSSEEVKVGDAVSYTTDKGEIIHGVIVRKNPSRATLFVPPNRKARVPYSMLKRSTEKIEVKTKDSFRTGETVTFLANTGVKKGVIVRRNPLTASVRVSPTESYTVGYGSLSKA